jgi:hypothetical protein
MDIQTKTFFKYGTDSSWTWILWLWLLVPLLLMVERPGVWAQSVHTPVAEVRIIYTSEWGLSHPAGLAYSFNRDHLALLAKESPDPAIMTGSTVVVITPHEDLVGSAELGVGAGNAINIAYDDTLDHLLLLNNTQAAIEQVAVGANGLPDPATLTRFDIGHLALQNAQGLGIDRTSRQLFILDSGAAQVVHTNLDTKLTLIAKIDLSHLGAATLRGMAVHPRSHHLFVVNPRDALLYELTQAGQLVNTYDLAILELVDARGLAFGPSTDLTDAPDKIHLFIADSNVPADAASNSGHLPGRLVEVALDVESSAPVLQMTTAQVASETDDSEENVKTGSTDLDSTDLELIRTDSKDQIVGIRFGNIAIPARATIVEAYIEFAADEKDRAATSLIFRGEATDTAAPFADPNGDISRRSLTTASVAWPDVPAWTITHEQHQTPNLSPIVQEIVDRDGWSSGNALAFIISGTGKRTAEAYEGDPARAPRLVITYYMDSVARASSSSSSAAPEQGVYEALPAPALDGRITQQGALEQLFLPIISR